MQWSILFAAALIFATLGKQLKPADEVYGIAVYSAGIWSALWGFAIAPTLAQIMLGAIALGWLQLNSLRT